MPFASLLSTLRRTCVLATTVTLLLVACSDGTATCGDAGGPAPMCMRGGPCSCDDEASHDTSAICAGGAWACPEGYTLPQNCRGFPPDCSDAGGEPEAGPDAGPDAGLLDAADEGFDSGTCGCDGSLACYCQWTTCPTYDAVLSLCSDPLTAWIEEFDYPGVIVIDGAAAHGGPPSFRYTFDATTHALTGAERGSDTGYDCFGGDIAPRAPTAACRVYCNNNNNNNYLIGVPACMIAADAGGDAQPDAMEGGPPDAAGD